LVDTKFHRYLIDGQARREIGHYGNVGETISKEQAQEAIRWAEEFIGMANNFLETA
jgi:hypothetical protein